MVDATALAGKFFDLRDKFGETLDIGQISQKPDEILVNRSAGQRLFVSDSPDGDWEEVGASAGPSSVERDCECGLDPDVECPCAMPTEAPDFVLDGRPHTLLGVPTAGTGDASAPPKQESGTGGPTWNTEAWKTPPARHSFSQSADLSAQASVQPRLLHDQNILDEAKAAVYGSRQANYGHPRENFRRIADIWNGYLKAKWGDTFTPLTPLDVAQMFVGAKQARLLETPEHRDSWVDIAGYAEAGARAAGVDE